MSSIRVAFLGTAFVATLLAMTLSGFGASEAFAGPVKVEVCHLPPGDPMNFHTIRVNANALDRHLAHGDLMQTCLENCEALCGDGDACTIDCDPVTELCLADHPPVDCNDEKACTQDSCDPIDGCLNSVDCDDGMACTFDACDVMDECGYMPIVCDPGETCDPGTGECGGPPPVCTVGCNLVGDCSLPPVAGDCPEPTVCCEAGPVG